MDAAVGQDRQGACGNYMHLCEVRVSLIAQLQKNLPAMQSFLCLEDPLEKGKATHSSILAREFHGLYSS